MATYHRFECRMNEDFLDDRNFARERNCYVVDYNETARMPSY